MLFRSTRLRRFAWFRGGDGSLQQGNKGQGGYGWLHERLIVGGMYDGQHKGETARRRWCSPFGLVEDRGGAVASRCRGGSRPCSATRGRRCRGLGCRHGAGAATVASSLASSAPEQRRPPLLAFPRGSSFFSPPPSSSTSSPLCDIPEF